ncbi:MAG: hypothetical protein Q9171_001500 [Xanthocarpia ochracea]
MRVSWVRYIACYSIIFGLTFLIAATTSAPALPQDHKSTLEGAKLVRRYDVIISIDYWHDIMRTGKVQTRPGVFWTSFPTSNPITKQGFLSTRGWARNYFGSDDGFVMFNTASDTYVDLNSITDECDAPTEAEFNLQVRRMSKAFAAAVHSVAYLVMPDDAPLYPGSVWSVWEWPMLTRNNLMDMVIRVYVPSGRQSLFWNRLDGPGGQPAPPGRRKIKARALPRLPGII